MMSLYLFFLRTYYMRQGNFSQDSQYSDISLMSTEEKVETVEKPTGCSMPIIQRVMVWLGLWKPQPTENNGDRVTIIDELI